MISEVYGVLPCHCLYFTFLSFSPSFIILSFELTGGILCFLFICLHPLKSTFPRALNHVCYFLTFVLNNKHSLQWRQNLPEFLFSMQTQVVVLPTWYGWLFCSAFNQLCIKVVQSPNFKNLIGSKKHILCFRFSIYNFKLQKSVRIYENI